MKQMVRGKGSGPYGNVCLSKWRERHTAGRSRHAGASLGMTPGIFTKKPPLVLKGSIHGSARLAGLLALETPGPCRLQPDSP